MEKGNPIPEWKKTYIRVNYPDMTAAEMAKALSISDCWVYAYCNQLGVRPKPSLWHKKNRPEGMKVIGHAYQPPYSPQKQQQEDRPPAVYSNKNWWEDAFREDY